MVSNAPMNPTRNNPTGSGTECFAWTKFYEAMADAILACYKNQRDELVPAIHQLAAEVYGVSPAAMGPGACGNKWAEVCPFTVMELFNNSTANRKQTAHRLAGILDLSEPVPEAFAGIPVRTGKDSWLRLSYRNPPRPGDIKALWQVFTQALRFHQPRGTDEQHMPPNFLTAYDKAMNVPGVGPVMLSVGLYWVRPHIFPPVDDNSREYIKGLTGKTPPLAGRAKVYMEVRNALLAQFNSPTCPVHSFPELYAACSK